MQMRMVAVVHLRTFFLFRHECAFVLQVSLASDFMWNWNAREATASFGYDYMLRQCRLRGRIDSEGKVGTLLLDAVTFRLHRAVCNSLCHTRRTFRRMQVAALLEERLNQGVNFLLSGEIDQWKKDYKFGFGLTVGE